jgi:hypothetical protein
LSRDRLLPGADCSFFRRFCRTSAVGTRHRVLTALPSRGADGVWLPHTLLEAPSPWGWRVQRDLHEVFRGLETSPYPRTVLRNGGAARVACARECQVRERGRTRQPGSTIAVWYGAEAGVQSQRRDRG